MFFFFNFKSYHIAVIYNIIIYSVFSYFVCNTPWHQCWPTVEWPQNAWHVIARVYCKYIARIPAFSGMEPPNFWGFRLLVPFISLCNQCCALSHCLCWSLSSDLSPESQTEQTLIPNPPAVQPTFVSFCSPHRNADPCFPRPSLARPFCTGLWGPFARRSSAANRAPSVA